MNYEKAEMQKSVRLPVRVDGVNVYNGNLNHAWFHPAKDNTGIVFSYAGREINADLDHAIFSRMAVALKKGSLEVRLVEHLLSAVYSLGIDNVIIDLSDGVCPTTNNCGKEYFDALHNNIAYGTAKKKFFEVSVAPEYPITHPKFNPDLISVTQAKGFQISYVSHHPANGAEMRRYSMEINGENYSKGIMTARPPAPFRNDLIKNIVLFLGKVGLHGLTEQNYFFTSINNPKKEIQDGYLGYSDNFVRHKTVDALGTMALIGRHFKNTKFSFNMTGHKFDIWALRELREKGIFKEHSGPATPYYP